MSKEKKNVVISLVIKCVAAVLAAVGVWVTVGMGDGFMSGGTFLYYTVQSNIVSGLTCVWFAVYDVLKLRKGYVTPNRAYAVKYSVTAAITLTFVVFSVMLTPQMIMMGQSGYLISVSNLCAHNAVPILLIVDFVLFDYRYESKPKSILLACVMPVYYLVFALGGSLLGLRFNGEVAPYFFFNYVTNGWFAIGNGKFGVVYWVIILVLMVLAIGWALLRLKDLRAAKMLADSDEKD